MKSIKTKSRSGLPTSLLPILLLILSLLIACSQPVTERASVVLVSADSLRVDRLAAWAHLSSARAAPPTPHLDRLAARGTLYLNAWATSPWTAPSMVSVLTGLYPPSHGVAYRDDTTPRTLPTLPRVLESQGYRLGNFSFFSQISYFRNLGLGSPIEGLRHKTVVGSFDKWLGEVPAEDRFFAWVHLLETHLPYGATGYRSTEIHMEGSSGLTQSQLKATVPVGSAEFEEGDRDRLFELYDRDVREMDQALGRLMEILEARGRSDKTLIVFVADHGEELLDDGWVGHASTSEAAKFLPQILRVPLILAGPGVKAGQVHRQRVQQVDILPTVLRLAGAPVPRPLDGQFLPGLFRRGFFGDRLFGGRLFGEDGRDVVFFDSSPGGNLTSQDDRGQRLQGATDGRCLLEIHTFPDRGEQVRTYPVVGETDVGETGGCTDDAEASLRSEISRWRKRQADQRLAVLAANPGPDPPPAEEVEGYAERMEVLAPRPGDVLRFKETRGLVTFKWKGQGFEGHWLEYQANGGLVRLEGSFQLDQAEVIFGPVPEGFWNDVAGYSPYRIRVIDPENRQRSPWVEFEVKP